MKYEIIALIRCGEPTYKILEYFKDNSISIKHQVFNKHKLDQDIDGTAKVSQKTPHFLTNRCSCSSRECGGYESSPCMRRAARAAPAAWAAPAAEPGPEASGRKSPPAGSVVTSFFSFCSTFVPSLS